MVTRAVLRYERITPRKFRLIIPLVKGKNPEDAIAILTGVKKKASGIAINLIKSAISNAKRMQGVDVSELYISSFLASGGPMLKRFRAGSMGRASMIKKRTSHITVELSLRDKGASPEARVNDRAEIKNIKAGEKKPHKKETVKGKHPETKSVKTTKKGKE